MKRVGAILMLVLVAGAGGAAAVRFLVPQPAPATVVETKTTVRPASKPDAPAVPAAYRDLTSCFAFDHGSDLAVEFVASNAGEVCWHEAQSAANGGSYWSVSEGPPTSVASQQSPYCTMRNGGAEALVYDSGGAIGGQRACANLVAAGWTDEQ